MRIRQGNTSQRSAMFQEMAWHLPGAQPFLKPCWLVIYNPQRMYILGFYGIFHCGVLHVIRHYDALRAMPTSSTHVLSKTRGFILNQKLLLWDITTRQTLCLSYSGTPHDLPGAHFPPAGVVGKLYAWPVMKLLTSYENSGVSCYPISIRFWNFSFLSMETDLIFWEKTTNFADVSE